MRPSRLLGGYAACVLCLVAVTRCGATVVREVPAPSAGSRDETITVGGVERHYRIHVPTSYASGKSVPLVLMLHGHGGNGPGFERVSGMSEKADREGFIVVYPSAFGAPPSWSAVFNRDARTIDDEAFFNALLDKLEKEYTIAPKRVYCAGFSAGAMMTYRLGATLSNRLAAIAVVAGSTGSVREGNRVTIPDPPRPIPVLHIHGRRDGAVVYDGGPTPRLGGGANHYLSVAESIQLWVKQNRCSPSPRETVTRNGNVVRDLYTGGRGSADVVLISIGNETHHWPGSPGSPPDDIDASDNIWEFFKAHPGH